jgi:hypothetical protein
MPKLPGISNAEAVRVFGKLGFRIARQGKHTIMSNGKVRLSCSRWRISTKDESVDLGQDYA